jgi:WhiB family redox-sensing transcriptional regulator
VTSDAWRQDALCPSRPDIQFFPEIGRGRYGRGHAWTGDEEAPARALCAACPVQLACLEEALANGEAGIWGGTSEEERRVMRSRRRRDQTRGEVA